MEKVSNMNLSYKAIRWGNCNTQDFRVASFLNTGAALTPMSAQVNLDGVGRLAARVGTINCLLDTATNPETGGGYPRIKNTIKRTANGKRYSEYRGTVPADVLAVL